MKKIKINHLDLFSGIGGFHLGFEKAGFEVNSYFSEVDKYAIDVYKNNFKNSNYVGSVTDVRGTQLPKIDAITFGSPCQDFSLAGKRKGMGGQRSSLITEAIRLIDECRPRFFVWENVKGTFSSNNGEDFWAIMQAFTNIGGYRLEWQLLNTKWFLPQNRERIYLVGYIAEGSRGQIFPISKSNKWNNEKTNKFTSTCITTSYHKGVNFDNQLIEVKSATKKGFEVATSADERIMTTEIGDFRSDEGYRKRKDGNCPTLPARARNDISGMLIVNKIRRLTPIECERLQGFPDNWTQYGESGQISDTQRYKMCGNAVTVDVVEAVAKNIIKTIY